MAYEKAFGPIGDDYRSEVLASIQEQLQNVVYVGGSTMGGGDMPKPQRYTRKGEAYIAMEAAQADDVDPADGTPVGGADELSAFFDALEK